MGFRQRVVWLDASAQSAQLAHVVLGVACVVPKARLLLPGFEFGYLLTKLIGVKGAP